MRGSGIDVSSLLRSVYQQPPPPADALAARVRARVALMETLAEVGRLLGQAPASAIGSTFFASKKEDR